MPHSTADALRHGGALFDAGAFFEAHEAWEERWRVADDPTERRFLQGLIQVAASYHKLLVMRSPESAARLAAKGLAKLDACPAWYVGMDVARFRDGVRLSTRAMTADRLDRASIPRVLPEPAQP